MVRPSSAPGVPSSRSSSRIDPAERVDLELHHAGAAAQRRARRASPSPPRPTRMPGSASIGSAADLGLGRAGPRSRRHGRAASRTGIAAWCRHRRRCRADRARSPRSAPSRPSRGSRAPATGMKRRRCASSRSIRARSWSGSGTRRAKASSVASDVAASLGDQQGAPVQLVAGEHGAEAVQDAAARRRDQPRADAVVVAPSWRSARRRRPAPDRAVRASPPSAAVCGRPEQQRAAGEHAAPLRLAPHRAPHARSGAATARCAQVRAIASAG